MRDRQTPQGPAIRGLAPLTVEAKLRPSHAPDLRYRQSEVSPFTAAAVARPPGLPVTCTNRVRAQAPQFGELLPAEHAGIAAANEGRGAAVVLALIATVAVSRRRGRVRQEVEHRLN